MSTNASKGARFAINAKLCDLRGWTGIRLQLASQALPGAFSGCPAASVLAYALEEQFGGVPDGIGQDFWRGQVQADGQ